MICLFLTVCSAFVRDGTNANEMGPLCVYLWGDYLEKTKNKQINKTFSKQSVSFVKPRGISDGTRCRRMQLKAGHLTLGYSNHVITSWDHMTNCATISRWVWYCNFEIFQKNSTKFISKIGHFDRNLHFRLS